MSASTNPTVVVNNPPAKQRWIRNIIDSFRRSRKTASEDYRLPQTGGFDHVSAAIKTANSGLAHKLKSRHLQMIAIGGAIGEL